MSIQQADKSLPVHMTPDGKVDCFWVAGERGDGECELSGTDIDDAIEALTTALQQSLVFRHKFVTLTLTEDDEILLIGKADRYIAVSAHPVGHEKEEAETSDDN